MSGEQISHALGSISDAALESAMDVYKRKQNRRGILRVAAIAAMIAILMTALLWLDGRENPTPYFSVYVYANETDTVELTVDQSAISNWESISSSTHRPIFDSHVGPGDPANPYKDMFCLKVRLDERTKDYKNFSIFLDGKKISLESSDKVLVGYSSTQEGDQKSLSILGKVEKNTRIDLVLYDDSGCMLQCYTLRVSPLDDGYKIELQENYITSNGSNIFSRFG